MKKFLTILSVALLSGTAVAQATEKNVQLQAAAAPAAPAQDSKAKIENAEKFAANKAKGLYEFQLPAGTTAESVKKTSSYYTQYFTVNYDAKTRNAKLSLLQTDEKAKHVIVRFLVSNNVKEITMGGKDYTTEEFFKEHIAK